MTGLSGAAGEGGVTAGFRRAAGPGGERGLPGGGSGPLAEPAGRPGRGRRARRPEEGAGRREEGRSRSRSRPAGRGRWRRDRLRELQLPCGLRNSRGVCRGDAIMASVLAREAAALRRRRESLLAALRPALSAQAPWAGRAGSGGGVRDRTCRSRPPARAFARAVDRGACARVLLQCYSLGPEELLLLHSVLGFLASP